MVTRRGLSGSKTIIGTFEESKKGGVDEDLINSYWLYINEANENDFKGKEVPMRIYSPDVKSLAFEILENAGAQKVFVVSSYENKGIEELVKYLEDDNGQLEGDK